LIVDTGLYGA